MMDPRGTFSGFWSSMIQAILVLLLMLTSYTIAFHFENTELPFDHWLEVANLAIDLSLLIDCFQNTRDTAHERSSFLGEKAASLSGERGAA